MLYPVVVIADSQKSVLFVWGFFFPFLLFLLICFWFFFSYQNIWPSITDKFHVRKVKVRLGNPSGMTATRKWQKPQVLLAYPLQQKPLLRPSGEEDNSRGSKWQLDFIFCCLLWYLFFFSFNISILNVVHPFSFILSSYFMKFVIDVVDKFACNHSCSLDEESQQSTWTP